MSLVTAPGDIPMKNWDVDVLIQETKDALKPIVARIAPKACPTALAAAVDKAVCFDHVYGIGYAISTNNNNLANSMCDTAAPFLITAIAKNSTDFSTAIVAAGAAKYKSFCDLISTALVDVVAKSNTIAAAAGYCKDAR